MVCTKNESIDVHLLSVIITQIAQAFHLKLVSGKETCTERDASANLHTTGGIGVDEVHLIRIDTTLSVIETKSARSNSSISPARLRTLENAPYVDGPRIDLFTLSPQKPRRVFRPITSVYQSHAPP